MEAINFQSDPFLVLNPYKEDASFKGKVYSALFKNEISQKTGDAFVDFADRITDWGKNLLFQDYEKQIEIVGKGATVLDWGIYIPIAALEGSVIANNLFHLQALPIFETFSTLYETLVVPGTTVLIGLAFVEGFAEVANLKRAKGLVKKMEERKSDPLVQLEWIKKRFFTLHPKEGEKIASFIEFVMPRKTQAAKAKRFDSIAEKAMKIKYQTLKRRLTPKLADEVRKEMSAIGTDLKSWNPLTRRSATQRAKYLMETVTLQAKNKMFIHFLAVVAISLSALSMALLVAGISAPILFGFIGSLSVLLLGVAFLVNRIDISKAVEHYYDSLPVSFYQAFSKKLYSVYEQWAPELLPHQTKQLFDRTIGLPA